MSRDRVDGWARLNDEARMDRAVKISMDAINAVMAGLDPEERDRLYAEFRAMSEADRADLIRRTLAHEGVELKSFADVKVP